LFSVSASHVISPSGFVDTRRIIYPPIWPHGDAIPALESPRDIAVHGDYIYMCDVDRTGQLAVLRKDGTHVKDSRLLRIGKDALDDPEISCTYLRSCAVQSGDGERLLLAPMHHKAVYV
jgi:hypothetical protein